MAGTAPNASNRKRRMSSGRRADSLPGDRRGNRIQPTHAGTLDEGAAAAEIYRDGGVGQRDHGQNSEREKTFALSRGKQSGTRNCAGRTQIGGGCPAELRSEPRRKIFGSAVYERDR